LNRLRRSTRPPTQWLLWLLIASAPLVSGCGLAKAIIMQTAPTTEKVPAEFNRLTGKRVLVYVWVRPEIKWAYGMVRLDLASYLSEYLAENVKDVTVVDYRRVESYLEKAKTSDVNPVELGRHFSADMVVHLSVYRVSLRDPGLAHFYRGRIGASVEVHDLSRPDEPPERIPLGDVEVAVPEEGPIGLTNVTPAEVRQRTYYVFTERVGRKFHEYEREVD